MTACFSDEPDLEPKTLTVTGLAGGEKLLLLDEDNGHGRKGTACKRRQSNDNDKTVYGAANKIEGKTKI